MFKLDVKNLGWRYWLITVCALTWGVLFDEQYFLVAIIITIVHLIHYVYRERSLTSFSVQVRIGFLTLLLVAQPDSMHWLYWLPVVGAWAQVLLGYCFMARMLSLLPWNRIEELSLPLVQKTFFSPPVQNVQPSFSKR
jgi:hypothetical protein